MKSLICGFVSLSIVVAGSTAAAQSGVKKDKKGGHPLADRSGSLEDLLLQDDWPIDAAPIPAPVISENADPPPKTRLSAESMPAPPPPPPPNAVDVAQQLQTLIDERNRIVDNGGNLLGVLRQLVPLQQQAGVLFRQLQAANAAVTAANGAVTQALAMGKGAPPGAVANARNQLNAALNRRDQAGRALNALLQRMQPLLERVGPAIGPWVACYEKMRAFFRHDRQDPNRPAVLRVMEQACGRRNDFYEGHVLAAIGQVYDGNADAAREHLKRACAGFADCDLLKSGFAHECCHALLLLGMPGEIDDWTDWVRKLDAMQQKPVKCWLVGLAAMLRGKDNEADQYFGKAISRSKMLAKAKPLPASPTLVGDAACFYLTCKNEKLRKPDKARELLGKVPASDASWPVLRARAALAAEDAEWQKAVELLDDCAKHVPPTLDDEVATQREAYTQKQRWVRGKDPA